jgi:hypothetical protein
MGQKFEETAFHILTTMPTGHSLHAVASDPKTLGAAERNKKKGHGLSSSRTT